jgi:hypothetical protein
MTKRLLLLLCSCFALKAYNQNPTATIATWKNDATGCYSFIHDDYGDNAVIGINDYADTIARNRGLKFTFGAITASCEANQGMWTQATDMIDYGHEIINHTHNHTCAIALSWCTDGLWAEPNTEDFATQMDLSTNLINTNTGKYPRYFIYPYDQFNTAANNHLKSLGYIGSRTGTYNSESASNFTADANGFYKNAFVVDVNSNGDPISLNNLNSYVDQAISNGTWINREMHNVGSSGWGSISVANYRAHLNYVKSKVNTNDIWVGTISEILTYQMQKTKYIPSTSYNANTKEIDITWNTPTFNVANYLQPLQVKSAITMKVFLDGLAGNFTITQNNQTINQYRVANNYLYFDAYPHEGPIKIAFQNCATLCLSQGINDTTTYKGNNLVLNFLANSNNNITYQWYFNDVLQQGKTLTSLTLNNIQTNQSGEYKIIAKSGNYTLMDSAIVTVLDRSPYNGIAANIPGTIQFEEYDLGGQNVAYYDDSQGNEANEFRFDDVDVEPILAGGYDIGWTMAGEWLEYTVNITQAGNYSIDVTHASQSSLGKIMLYLDGTAFTSNMNLTKTNSYDTYKTTTTNYINIGVTGTHILRVAIVAGDVNLDKIKFTYNPITAIANIEKPLIQVYPNPSNNNFIINFNNENISRLTLTNMEGKLMEEFNNTTNSPYTIIGENLPAGVYFLQAFNELGSIQTKLIKQ